MIPVASFEPLIWPLEPHFRQLVEVFARRSNQIRTSKVWFSCHQFQLHISAFDQTIQFPKINGQPFLANLGIFVQNRQSLRRLLETFSRNLLIPGSSPTGVNESFLFYFRLWNVKTWDAYKARFPGNECGVKWKKISVGYLLLESFMFWLNCFWFISQCR